MIEIRKVKRLFFLLKTFKIPIIGFTGCKIDVINGEQCTVKIRLKRRNRNHLNSMYFGSMSIGADVAAGMLVLYHFELQQAKPHFSFKSVHGHFLKRAETDVIFSCNDGIKTQLMVKKAKDSKERQEEVLVVNAKNTSGEIVAKFEMLVSVKLL